MAHIYANYIRLTESTLVHTGEGFLMDILIHSDGINDPIVAAHDDTDGDTAANELKPATEYDASVLGENGIVFRYARKFTTGLYIKITNIGSGLVSIGYRTQGGLFPMRFR